MVGAVVRGRRLALGLRPAGLFLFQMVPAGGLQCLPVSAPPLCLLLLLGFEREGEAEEEM